MVLQSRSQSFTKETIRAWLIQRWERRVPLPDIQQIRQELGWEGIAPANVTIQTKASN
jgi:hypothetical protein